MKIIKFVLDSIRKVPKFKDSTDDLIGNPVKQWLAQAPARISKKEKKNNVVSPSSCQNNTLINNT